MEKVFPPRFLLFLPVRPPLLQSAVLQSSSPALRPSFPPLPPPPPSASSFANIEPLFILSFPPPLCSPFFPFLAWLHLPRPSLFRERETPEHHLLSPRSPLQRNERTNGKQGDQKKRDYCQRGGDEGEKFDDTCLHLTSSSSPSREKKELRGGRRRTLIQLFSTFPPLDKFSSTKHQFKRDETEEEEGEDRPAQKVFSSLSFVPPPIFKEEGRKRTKKSLLVISSADIPTAIFETEIEETGGSFFDNPIIVLLFRPPSATHPVFSLHFKVPRKTSAKRKGGSGGGSSSILHPFLA